MLRLFHKGDVFILVYVNDCIIVSKSLEGLAKTIEQLKEAKINITDKRNVSNYLGVRVTKLTNGKIKSFVIRGEGTVADVALFDIRKIRLNRLCPVAGLQLGLDGQPQLPPEPLFACQRKCGR